MKNFFKSPLFLGLYNVIVAIECALLFYFSIKLIIRIHNTTGFAAIGMFILGIILICGGILLLYVIGSEAEYFIEDRDEKKEDSEKK